MNWFKKIFSSDPIVEDKAHNAGDVAAKGVSLPPFEKEVGYRDNARPSEPKPEPPVDPDTINGGRLKRAHVCECKKKFPSERQCKEFGIEKDDTWTCSKCKLVYKRDDDWGWWNGISHVKR